MTEGLHASMNPNHLAPGETLTIRFDSQGTDFENAQNVRIQVFEVDDRSALEPRGGRNTLVVEFRGNMQNNEFEASGDPRLPRVRNARHNIRIRVEPDTEVEVPLPGADVEQGVYELRLVVTAGRPRGARFASTDTIFVRAYDHFRTSGTARPVIAFVTGAGSDTFFRAAQGFWGRNADAMLVRSGMSLKEILEVLDSEGEKFGPWGQINIVAHGAPHSINIKVFPDSPTTTHEDIIDQELARTDGDRTLPSPDSIDDQTQVVFRSCNAGRTPSLVSKIKDEFFADAAFVKIPKWVQGYFSSAASAREFFQEELEFDRPTQAEVTADENTVIRQEFDSLVASGDSPGLAAGADPAVEIPLFTERKITTGRFDFTKAQMMEKDLRDAGGPKNDATLIAEFRSEWDGSLGLDQRSSTARTRAGRWSIALRRTELHGAAAQNAGVAFESAQGSPNFRQLSGGAISIGSRSGDPLVWQLTAAGVEDLHVNVQINSRTRVEIEQVTDAGTTVVGGRTLSSAGDRATVGLPTTLTLGAAQVRIRPGKIFDLVFNATRKFLHRRRDMRTFDATQDYADRALVPGDLNDAHLYETAQ